MADRNYWQKRFQAIEERNHRSAMKTVQAVSPAFDSAQATVEKEINAWYQRFADNNGVSLTEAKKMLNARELKELKWDVEKYIEMGQQNSLDQKWMKELENASARYHISRLEALKIRVQQQAELAMGNELDQLDSIAARLYTDGYYQTAYEIQRGLGVGWDIGQIDQRKLRSVLDKPWTADKLTFSDRIWKSKTQLVDSVSTEITQMCMLGKKPDEAIKRIAKQFDVSKGQAGRLIMTESAYFSSKAQKDCFTDLDVEKYEIVATLDRLTSKICQEMDGKVLDMKDFEPGVTAPPFHPWCRTATVPWFEDNNDGTRAARGEDGKTYQVPADMKYQDWKAAFVDKTKDPADWLTPASTGDILDLKSKIRKVKDDISANGGVITEDHIKEAGKAVQEELLVERNKLKVKLETLEAEYNASDVKKQLDLVQKKRNELQSKLDRMFFKDPDYNSIRTELAKAQAEYSKLMYDAKGVEYRNQIRLAQKEYKGTWKSNSDELKSKLSEFRTVGVGNHDLKKEHYSNRGTLRDIVTTAYDHYPSDWVESSINHGKIDITKVNRGFYGGSTIAISGWDLDDQIETAFHELGHRFEGVIPGIKKAEKAFYARRTAGEDLTWLGRGYSKSEKTRVDNFLHPYMGKDYGGNWYELVSMGFEYAYTNPTRLWEDEDFAQFIYGILALF